MKTIVRRNERSWAIVIISEIRAMIDQMDLKVKSAGGERTLAVGKQRMFPDVLLYEDAAQNKVLQGWELKMPDVGIADLDFIRDAARKADALGLNSFVIWNFTYGKLYVKNAQGIFTEARVWNETDFIHSREEVALYQDKWLPVIREIVLTVNEYLLRGTIASASVKAAIADGLLTQLIQRNKALTAEKLRQEANRNMTMECWIKRWWTEYEEEFAHDETDLYAAYAKYILLNWINRILFANAVKKYHNCAYRIEALDHSTTPADGNNVIDWITAEGDFFHIFCKVIYNECLPDDTWRDLVDYNRFLVEHGIEQVEQSVLQEILEQTVHTAKREIRGQFPTPYVLADLLCQMTVLDWQGTCADLCAGTGTIAKALIDNKARRLLDLSAAYQTTWMSDKHTYPLQIANIAVTRIEALNLPLQLFLSDVFAVETGREIEMRSPVDGSRIVRTFPPLDAIVSNLPFVEYNKIASDEAAYIRALGEKIFVHSGISLTLGKTDLYHYIPFKLHELLSERGRLGMILSNSWLGTEIGRKFFDALQYFYHLRAVVISDCGRWFQNAEVVASILLLEKKEIGAPDEEEEISFWLLHEDIWQLETAAKEQIIGSVVLNEALDASAASVKKYSLRQVKQITGRGIALNALFHDVSWIAELSDCLIPAERLLTIKRGERRGWNELFYPAEGHGIEDVYLKPVLKNPALLKSYLAQPDLTAFCCHRTKEELKQLGHSGALRWIEKFEQMKNKTGRLLPEALKRPGCRWYEMDDGTKADFVTALTPDRRLFVARFLEPAFVDQRFTRMLVKEYGVSRELLHALLNSLYGMFAIEAVGFGRGLGVLDASSTKLKKICLINPALISPAAEAEIVALFEKVKQRGVWDTEDELEDAERERFDRALLRAIGKEALYEPMKKSLRSMQHTRHAVFETARREATGE